jgi:hypothetical protein
MQFYSNQEIVEHLERRPGGIRSFLLEVPIQELRDALDEKERISDLQFRAQHGIHDFR